MELDDKVDELEMECVDPTETVNLAEKNSNDHFTKSQDTGRRQVGLCPSSNGPVRAERIAAV